MNDVESTPDSETGKKIVTPSLSTPQAEKSAPKSLKNSRSVAKVSNRGSFFTARPTSGLKMSRNTGVKAKVSLPGPNPYEATEDSTMKDGTNPFRTIQASKSTSKLGQKPLYSKTTQKYLDRLVQPVVTSSPLRKRPAKAPPVDGEDVKNKEDKKEIKSEVAKEKPNKSATRPKSNYATMTASRKLKAVEPRAPVEKAKKDEEKKEKAKKDEEKKEEVKNVDKSTKKLKPAQPPKQAATEEARPKVQTKPKTAEKVKQPKDAEKVTQPAVVRKAVIVQQKPKKKTIVEQ